MMKKIMAITLTGILMTGSALAQDASPLVPTNESDNKDKKTSEARMNSLKQHALATGIADGRRSRFIETKQKMMTFKQHLDVIYDVGFLYLENGLVQPPIVVLTSQNMQKSKDGRTIDWNEVSYKIVSPEKFENQQFQWDSFLISDEDLMSGAPPQEPQLMPRNEEEKTNMAQLFKMGFEEGYTQASYELTARIKSMTTLVSGMYIYHILNVKNMIEAPRVSRMSIPLIASDDQIKIDNKSWEISQGSKFVKDMDKYKAYIDVKNPWAK